MLARWHRQAGDDTWLLTGTDEHGQKILRTAVANDTTPKEWADKLVDGGLAAAAEDHRHRATTTSSAPPTSATRSAVTLFLQKLYDDGYIYSGEYEGHYCVGCEEYKQLDDLMEVDGELVCKIHGRPVEVLQGAQLLLPDERLPAASARPVRGAARTSCSRRACATRSSSSSSRGSTTCRSPGPASTGASRCRGTTRHVVYVWFDALLNYITAIGYGTDEANFAPPLAGRPPGRQGHRPLPRRDLAGHADGRRPRAAEAASSATAGCSSAARRCPSRSSPASRPSEITDTFGSDAFRYYFMRAIQLRPGRLVQLGGPRRPLPGRAGQRLRQPRLPRDRHGRRATSTASCPAPADVHRRRPGHPEDARARPRPTRMPPSTRLAIHDALAAIWTIVDELNGYITDAGAVGAGEDPTPAASGSARCCTPPPRDCARSPCCSRR